jgi:hypothetical protein
MISRRLFALSTHCALWAACALALSIGLSHESGAEPVNPNESSNQETLARILERAKEFEKMYVGSYSRRRVTTKILDGSSGKLKRKQIAVVDVWERHGEHPTNHVRQCTLNDKPVDIKKCVDPRRLEPAYRLFAEAENGELRYRFRYTALDSWKGQASHKIRIIPVKKTLRHLEGDIFFHIDTLQIVGMKITLADYPFGLKELSIELNFEDRDGRPVIASGESSATLYVPLLINDRALTVFTASQQRLLTKEDSLSAMAIGS